VSLRRMRKGVRAAPGEDRPGTPAVPSHPEAAAPTRSHASHTPPVRPESADSQLQQQAASLCREHIHLVLARILQHEPGGRPNPASLHGASPDGAAAVSESARPRHLVGAVPHPPSKHSSSAAGRETGCPDSNARFRWDATVHRDTAVIMDERSRKDARPIGRTTYERPFRLPQHSQHLPFPFSHTRVEVGRPVMEG